MRGEKGAGTQFAYMQLQKLISLEGTFIIINSTGQGTNNHKKCQILEQQFEH